MNHPAGYRNEKAPSGLVYIRSIGARFAGATYCDDAASAFGPATVSARRTS